MGIVFTPEELDTWAEDPVGFIEEVLGEGLWDKQADICESVRDHKRTAVASCHGSGKTNVAARIALWWLFTHPYSVIVTTAPTLRQVVKQLWKEVRAAHRAIKWSPGGHLMPKAPQYQLDGDDWMCIGFSTDSPDSFQGWHSEGGNLFIFDEATGVHDSIWDAVRGCLTGQRDRFLAIGNPTDPASEFAKQFVREDVNTIHISAFDVPNVAQNKEVIPGLTSMGWVREMQEECGPSYDDHPDYVSRVLGRFPDKDDRALIPASWIDAAEERWHSLNEKGGWKTECRLGVDVARKGSSKTIFAEAYDGLGVKELHKEPGQSTMETAARVAEVGDRLGAASWRIDADGIGAGVADRCEEIDPGRTVEMRGGMKSESVDSDGNPRYLNLRAEWYWSLRDRLDPQYSHAIALPPDKALRAQLTSIRWNTTSRGLKKIESKEDMARRGIKSPDEADSVVYSQAIASKEKYDVLFHLQAMTSL